MTGEQSVSALVERGIAAYRVGDPADFRLTVESLEALGWDQSMDLVDENLHYALVGRLGTEPSYDDIIKLAKLAAVELGQYLEVSGLALECVIRRFYGEPELVRELPMNVVQIWEMALTGLCLRSSS